MSQLSYLSKIIASSCKISIDITSMETLSAMPPNLRKKKATNPFKISFVGTYLFYLIFSNLELVRECFLTNYGDVKRKGEYYRRYMYVFFLFIEKRQLTHII